MNPSMAVAHVASASLCLLASNPDKATLVPIAIRLTADGPVFTPRDSVWDWRTAKAHVMNADSQEHQARAHSRPSLTRVAHGT